MDKIRIVLKKSVIGCNKKQRANVKGLGLKRIDHCVIREDSAEIRGMINKIPHLLQVTEYKE